MNYCIIQWVVGLGLVLVSVVPPNAVAKKKRTNTSIPKLSQLAESTARQLGSASQAQRSEAREQIHQSIQKLGQSAVAVLASAMPDGFGKPGDPVHLAAGVVGDLRVESAIPACLDALTYTLEPAPDDGAAGSQYPCAQALIRIGGNVVTDAVCNTLAAETGMEQRRLLTWILYRIWGMELAMRQLELAAANHDQWAAKRLLDVAREIPKADKLLSTPKKLEVKNVDGTTVAGCLLDRSIIFGVVKDDMPHWSRCLKELAEKQPDAVPKKLELGFTITNRGQLRDFRIINKHLMKGEFYECMARFFTTLDLPESEGSNCTIDRWGIPLVR